MADKKESERVSISKQKFIRWVSAAVQRGLLMLDPHAPTITMTVKGSGMFVVGQTNDDPFVFIGVHSSMMPWFLDMPWIRADVIPSCNRIHMVAQMNENTQLTFILHEDKGLCQWLTKVDPSAFKLPFRTFITMENESGEREIAWSKAVSKRLKFRILKGLDNKPVIQKWAKECIK